MLYKMRQIFYILFSSIIIVNCGQTSTQNINFASDDLKYDTSVIAIIPYDSANNRYFERCKQTQLTQEDIFLIDSIIIKSVNTYNNELEKKYNDTNEKEFRSINIEYHLINLKKYKRQYIAVTNTKGEKEVWVNIFCRTDYFLNWKTKLFNVKDGGNCFFNLKINLTKGMYYDFYVNGNG